MKGCAPVMLSFGELPLVSMTNSLIQSTILKCTYSASNLLESFVYYLECWTEIESYHQSVKVTTVQIQTLALLFDEKCFWTNKAPRAMPKCLLAWVRHSLPSSSCCSVPSISRENSWMVLRNAVDRCSLSAATIRQSM